MIPKPLLSRSTTRLVIAGVVMFFIGWSIRRQVSTDLQQQPEQTEIPVKRPQPMSGRTIASDLTNWSEVIDQANDRDLSSIASRLLASSHSQSTAHWAPLLARWSTSDGPGMISFIETQAPPSIRDKLLQNAWFAWGYADPDGAFSSSSKLSNLLTRNLLMGIAELSPIKAADFVRKVPDSQFAAWPIASLILEADPDLADKLTATAVYDGGRGPFEKAKIKHLAKADPAAAIAYAQSLGVIARDKVPEAVKEVALTDPSQAADLVDSMPRNRSRALSAVALASTWAATDPDAASTWARENLSGPVLHYSLVAAASSSHDPETALDLINEAGWHEKSDFFNIRDWGSMTASEGINIISAQGTARALLERVAQVDPHQAEILLETRIPKHLHSSIVVGTSLEP